MKALLHLLVFIFAAFSSTAQDLNLIYLKTDASQRSRVFPGEEGNYMRIYPGSAVDASLLPGPPYVLGSELDNGSNFVFYDDQLAPYTHVEIAFSSNRIIRPLKKIDERILFYSGAYSWNGGTDFSSYPALSGNAPDPMGATFLLEYDYAQNTLRMPFNCLCQDMQSDEGDPFQPIESAEHKMGVSGVNNLGRNINMAYLNDGTVIAAPNVFHQIAINQESEFQIGEDKYWGVVWFKINPEMNQIIPTPMFSENGTALTHSLQGSEDGDHIYRAGILWGNDLQISPDGTTWNSSAEQDSLLYAYMMKENAQGENIWTTPLFAYQNTYPTESSQFQLNQFLIAPIQEINSNVYTSIYYSFTITAEGDSLYFNDFMGDEGVFGKPDSFTPVFGSMFRAKSAREVIHMDENGNPVNKLVFPNRSPDPSDFYNLGWNIQDNQLFKVNDKLGWPLAYASAGDTTLYLIKQTPGEDMDSTGVSLPAGRGTFILWLDGELNAIGLTNFTYSTGSILASPGVNLTNVRALNNDTLMISGSIGNNVTTTLDPGGSAEEVTYSPSTGFVGLYTLPGFLLSADNPQRREAGILLYPNPASSTITVQTQFEQPGNYSIVDMVGREITRGYIPGGHSLATIDVRDFKKGVYVFRASGNEGKPIAVKFVVR